MKSQLLSSLLLLTAACASDDPTMSMPAHELGVSASSSVRVIRERAVEVPIEIVRSEDLEGPVTIEIDDLPTGVSAQPLEIAEGETTGTLKLFAVDGIALGERTKVTIRATAGETVAMTAMELRLTDRPGSLDKTFATGGMTSAHYSPLESEMLSHVALQPDGKIVAAGSNSDFHVTMVTRFNPDGSIDKNFGDGGSYPGPVALEIVSGIAVRPDGTILVVAYEGTKTNLRLLSSEGYALKTVVLSAVELGGAFAARSMVAMPDGSVYLSGIRDSNATVVVVRLDANLAIDTTFDKDGSADIYWEGYPEAPTLLRQPDGKLVVTGWASDAMMKARYAAARLNADGSPDTSFSGDGWERYDMLPSGGLATSSLLPDGRIAAVTLAPDEQVSMVYIAPDGTIDMTKTVPMAGYPRHAVTVTDGLIVVGSTWTATDWYATKFGTDGSIQPSFGLDGVMQAHTPTGGVHGLFGAVQLDADRAYAVGTRALATGENEQTLIRLWL